VNRGTALASSRAEAAMNVVVEIAAAMTGVAVGIGAARLFLAGILAFAFKGR
jgi:hypothetical protein